MADINAQLKKAMDGPAPQHKVAGQEALEITEGSGGNLHVKDNLVFQKVEELRALIEAQESKVQTVKDADVLNKLGALESKIQATNDRLNQTLDTQLTGRNVVEEQIIIAQPITANGGVQFVSFSDMDNYDKITVHVRFDSSSPFRVVFRSAVYGGNTTSEQEVFIDSDKGAVTFDVVSSRCTILVYNDGIADRTLDAWRFMKL